MAATEEALLQCYNKGCGKKFKKEENNDSACCYHPGEPVFHDAMKGWSCCKKRSTDFSEFLSIPGCTTGNHNNVKPPEPVKKVVKSDPDEVIVHKPKVKKPVAPMERPPDNAPFVKLPITVGSSLKTQLAKKQKEKTTEAVPSGEDAQGDVLKIGMPCKNKGCIVTYNGEGQSPCQYHSGTAIFHEGYKFWSCCKKRTTEFTDFLQQPGCTTGEHAWKLPGEKTATVLCRYDWHQTGGFVNISIYAKGCVPEQCSVEANATNVAISLVYNYGDSQHDMKLNLYGIILTQKSSVELLGSKAEVKLKKAEPMSWSGLEYYIKKPSTEKATAAPDSDKAATDDKKAEKQSDNGAS